MLPALIQSEPYQRVMHKKIEAIADGVCDAVILIALEGARPEDNRSEAFLTRQRKKVIEGLAELERLTGGTEWFAESRFGLAEIAIVCALDYVDSRCPDHRWRTHAHDLIGPHEILSRRPSLASTTPQPQTLPGL